MQLLLLRTCHSALARVKGKYLIPSLLVTLDKKKQTAVQSGLFKEGELQETMEGRRYSAGVTLFWFVAAVTDKRLGSMKRLDLTG